MIIHPHFTGEETAAQSRQDLLKVTLLLIVSGEPSYRMGQAVCRAGMPLTSRQEANKCPMIAKMN